MASFKSNALAIIKRASSKGRRALDVYESLQLISYCGLNVCKFELARSVNEAVTLAEEIGFPVVLKVSSLDITHKFDVGAVALNLRSSDEVKVAFVRIVENVFKSNPLARIRGVVVQEMVTKGYEVIVGGYIDEQFGPVVMYGSGGLLVELFKDVVFDIAPVTQEEALEMISRTKSHKLLQGYRGGFKADINSLSRLIAKTSEVIWELRNHIKELDLNPVFVLKEGLGCKVADARVVLR